ncbi:helix-turn-helix domain-containing protein [Planctomycetaceae bacterium SH139]
MEKSIGTEEYRVFLRVLKQARKSSGMTQTELAIKIAETQSFVSKVERGELRLDLVQLRSVCQALGKDLGEFIQEFEDGINRGE